MNPPDIYSAVAVVAADYRYSKAPDFLVFLQELMSRVIRFLNDLLSLIHLQIPESNDSRLVSNLLQIALFSLAFIASFSIIIFLIRQFRSRQSEASKRITKARANSISFNSLDWQHEGERLAEAKQWREACRAIYFAYLRMLDERQVLNFSPTRTNYEYFKALSRHKDLSAILQGLVEIVESAWFGIYQAQPTDFENCQNLLLSAILLLDKDT